MHLLVCGIFSIFVGMNEKRIIAVIIMVLMMVSCKTKYIETERVRDVYHHTVDTLRDSIYHDVYVNQYIKGDTVFNEKVVNIYKEHTKTKTDTIHEVDTIPKVVKVPEKVTVTKEVTDWRWVAIAVVSWILFIIYLWVRKKISSKQ